MAILDLSREISDLLFNRFRYGIQFTPWRFIVTFFLTLTSGWAVIDAVVGFIPDAQNFIEGGSRLFVLVVASLAVAGVRTARPARISFDIQNHHVVVKFGDLFAEQGYKVIPVSRDMHETDVVKFSLQDQVIERWKDAQSEDDYKLRQYHQLLENAILAEVPTRTSEDFRNREKVDVGTIAKMVIDGDNYIYLAFTETEDQKGLKALEEKNDSNASPSILWQSLEGLWKGSRTVLRGRDINVPLIGPETGGIKLTPDDILTLILVSLASTIRYQKSVITTGEIRIVIFRTYLDDIDLRMHQRKWSRNY